jgi:predicted DCC family thiol-disulfide oxidoreductase YuxK
MDSTPPGSPGQAVPSSPELLSGSVTPRLVVLFDGVCNLCNGSIQFIIKRDPGARFHFASLQSPAGRQLLEKAGLIVAGSAHPPAPDLNSPGPDPPGLNSFVLLENGKVFTRSSAALRVLKQLGGGWKLLYAFRIVPPFIRDGVYDWIARNRYRWFGRQEACWIPTPELKERFLDQ